MLFVSQLIRFVKKFFKNKSINKMRKKKKTSPDKHSEGPSKNRKKGNPDKRYPNPDDPYEETGPPIKEMPITAGPHDEEITDYKPK